MTHVLIHVFSFPARASCRLNNSDAYQRHRLPEPGEFSCHRAYLMPAVLGNAYRQCLLNMHHAPTETPLRSVGSEGDHLKIYSDADVLIIHTPIHKCVCSCADDSLSVTTRLFDFFAYCFSWARHSKAIVKPKIIENTNG